LSTAMGEDLFGREPLLCLSKAHQRGGDRVVGPVWQGKILGVESPIGGVRGE